MFSPKVMVRAAAGACCLVAAALLVTSAGPEARGQRPGQAGVGPHAQAIQAALFFLGKAHEALDVAGHDIPKGAPTHFNNHRLASLGHVNAAITEGNRALEHARRFASAPPVPHGAPPPRKDPPRKDPPRKDPPKKK